MNLSIFLQKTNFNLQKLLWIILIIYGSLIVSNSMIRFENQIFSCYFWLTCEGDTSLAIGTNLFTQLLLSFTGLILLVFINFRYFFKGGMNFFKSLPFFIMVTAVIIFSISFISYFYAPVNPIIQTGFVLFISILLMILIVNTQLKRETINYSIHRNLNIHFLVFSSFIMFGLGYFISITGISELCNQFPLCFTSTGFSIEILIINLHRLFTLTTGVFLLKVFLDVWKKYRDNQKLLVSITVSFVMFIGQSLVGGVQVSRNLPFDLLFVHSTGSIIYILAIIFAFQVMKYSIQANDPEIRTIFNDSQRRKDFLLLNKPIIVILLLVTTYAGMVVGGEKIPTLSLTFWTMVGGALAAGGASAINQYIDREIDQTMQRTSKRPLPAKRLLPSEALALGVSEIILSFYIFATFVNLNAALLAMAGMFYYVYIYSIWLKHVTVQNIVIGGGAGAIPPLVGWAAATGGLNVPSLFLFALVFLWTPPHFWALALVRKNDYARASIPMLPVIRGEENTRFQIFIYTIQLVILTLLMPLIGIGGTIYLISALILGLWLLSTAWQVYIKAGNKLAYRMYRYSSMYLAFIFFAMVIDVLIKI